jgi:hypothetical protein
VGRARTPDLNRLKHDQPTLEETMARWDAVSDIHPSVVTPSDIPAALDISSPSANWWAGGGVSTFESAQGPGQYKRRKQMKLTRRKERKGGHPDVWDLQIKEHAQQKQAEQEAAQRAREQMRQRVMESLTDETMQRHKDKKLAQAIDQENLRLAEQRSPTVQPKGYTMGNIFQEATEHRSAKPDLEFLKKQIDEKKALQQSKRAEQVELEKKAAERETQLVQKEDSEVRVQKRAKQLMNMTALEEQIKSNNHIKSQSQINISKDDDEGNFFFKSKTLQELKDEGTRLRMQKRTVLRQFFERSQEEEKIHKEQRQREKEEAIEKERQRANEDSRLLRVARMKELEGKHQSRKEMKAAWDSQVQRKQELKDRPEAPVAPRVIWKNSSSDED